jgi:hydrogenase maturation protease
VTTERHLVVVGTGNPDRGDDGAGAAVAERVAAAKLPGVLAIVDRGDPTTIVDACEDAVALYVVDTCRTGSEPGTVHRVDAAEQPLTLATSRPHSSHSLSAAEAIEIARALGRLPARVVVYAIEGGAFDIGAPMSGPVATAVDWVADELLDAVREPG